MSSASTPVFLLHGCGGSMHATFEATGWLDAIRSMGREPVAPDLPGHGRRDASREPADYADLAGQILRELPPRPFDAVGFSLGSKLLLEIALREPGRVGRLVLGGVGDNVFAPEAIAPIAAHALEFPGSADAGHPAVRAMLQVWEPDRNDPLAVAAVLRRPPNPVFTPGRLRALSAPVLIVNGSDDPVGSMGDVLASSLRDARRKMLPGVDHFGLPRQQAFRSLALEFLANGDATG